MGGGEAMTAIPDQSKQTAELNIPERLGDLASFNLERFGEYNYLYYEGKPYTNSWLADQAQRLATGLQQEGVNPGDRVIVMMINSPEVLVSYQAILRMAGVVVPLLPVLKTPEIQYVAANCRPKAIITNLPLVPLIKPALQNAGLAEYTRIIAVGPEDEVKTAGVTGYSELISHNPPLSSTVPGSSEDLAIIIYTSGTTGNPKGVMLSHKNKISNLKAGASDLDHVLGRSPKPRETNLAALPLAHAFGLSVSNVSYLTGHSLVLLPRFENQRVFEAIEQYKVTGMAGVPAMLIAMLNYPEAGKYDTSSFKKVVSGAAPLPESVLKGFEQKFGAIIHEGYGLSEATTAVSGHPEGIKIKPGSVGTQNSSNIVKIFDTNDQELPAGERGEIVVQGDNVMLGYYNNPQATAEAIRDGWLHTGDIGFKDEEDYIYIVERKKDLIIRNGQNVYPRDAEEVLAQHPAVMEVAVVGVPSEKYGEEVKAFITLRPGHQVTAEELKEFCQVSLANYKTPAYFEFIEALPRNPVGKINKRALREKSVGPV